MRPSLAATIVISVMLLVSCVTIKAPNDNPINLDNLNIDPLTCTEIALRNDVPVGKEVIHEESIMPNTFLIVLRYREGGDEEVTANLLPGYINVSLVFEVEAGSDTVHRRYCVVEMWRFYPEKKAKLCYLWTIGDESVNMKVMMEDLLGRYLDERIISLDVNQVDELKAFRERLTKNMLQMMKEPLPDV